MLKKMKIRIGKIMPKERFCMSWTILQGSKFISYIYTIFTLLILVGLSLLFCNWDSLSGSLMEQVNGNSTNLSNSRCMSAFVSVFIRVIVRNFIILGIAFNSFFLLLCIGLIYGLFKGSKRFAKPWLVVEVIRLVVSFLLFLMLCWGCSTLVSMFNYNPSLPIACCVAIFIIIAVTLYFWMVVKAAIEEMPDDKKKSSEVSPDDD